MPKPKIDPIRARNLGNDYARWLLQEQRERTPANGKLFIMNRNQLYALQEGAQLKK